MVASAVTILLDSDFVQNSWLLKPGFGETSCWFYGDLEILIYFYGPIAILLLVNLALFVSTIAFLTVFQKRISSKKSPALRKHSVGQTATAYSQGRERLELYSRVFIIMGVSWIFEIIVRQLVPQLCIILLISVLDRRIPWPPLLAVPTYGLC